MVVLGGEIGMVYSVWRKEQQQQQQQQVPKHWPEAVGRQKVG